MPYFGGPAEAGAGGGLGFVFQADIAVVAQPIEHIEQVEVVDLADVGFVAVGVAGDLHMRGDGEQPLRPLLQITFRHLQVIEIELQAQMRRADLVDDRLHLVRGVGEVAWNVAMVDRLQNDRDAALGGAVADLLQVRHEGAMHRLRVGARRDHARHDVQGPALQHLGVLQRLLECGGKFGFAAGQGGQPALALAGIARRQVEQRLGAACAS